MDAFAFLSRLRSQVPEVEPTFGEYVADNDGEMLLHLLVGDLQRLALSWFTEGRREELSRLLFVMEAGLNDGDEYVENAIAVSFVWDTGWWDESMRDFVASWPNGLLDEVKRQRDASS